MPDIPQIDPHDIQTLRAVAEIIIRIDGDRDHMNHSDLSCEQTVAIARLMRSIANRLAPAEPV